VEHLDYSLFPGCMIQRRVRKSVLRSESRTRDCFLHRRLPSLAFVVSETRPVISEINTDEFLAGLISRVSQPYAVLPGREHDTSPDDLRIRPEKPPLATGIPKKDSAIPLILLQAGNVSGGITQ